MFKSNGMFKNRVQLIVMKMMETNEFTSNSEVDREYAIELLKHFKIKHKVIGQSVFYDQLALYFSDAFNYLD